MADDIRRWSDELARDPSSLVFLQLAEALRRRGQLELALKIAVRGLERHSHNGEAHDLLARICVDRGDLQRAFDEWDMVLRLTPSHVGAMKGLGYICYQEGRRDDAEKYLRMAAEHGGEPEVVAALENVRRSGPVHASTVSALEETHHASSDDPRRLFADLLGDHDQTALLLDAQGLVLAGIYVDSEAHDVSQEVGAELSGVSDEAQRASRHLDLGDWRSIVVETEVAVIAMLPAAADNIVMLAASRATPLGLVRRLSDRCVDRARGWLGGGGRA
jgi:predicted regulator of Ras-like GTPase activity (Roadblock/LC7/MglB family)